MTDKEFIERLGGVKTVAAFFDFKRTTVHNWIHRGIPAQIKVDYPEYFMNKNPKPLNPNESPFTKATT